MQAVRALALEAMERLIMQRQIQTLQSLLEQEALL
jgi:hypothetical protein